jgi:hypothetical protein
MCVRKNNLLNLPLVLVKNMWLGNKNFERQIQKIQMNNKRTMLPTSHAPPNNPSTPQSPSKIRTYVHTPTEAKVVLPFELSPSNSNYSLFNTNGEILLGDAPPSRTRRPWFTYVVSAIQVVTLFIPLCTCQIA